MEVVLEWISQTTTDVGLMVTALKDSRRYLTGRTVSDEAWAAVPLETDAFPGEWNYTIRPRASPASVQLI